MTLGGAGPTFFVRNLRLPFPILGRDERIYRSPHFKKEPDVKEETFYIL